MDSEKNMIEERITMILGSLLVKPFNIGLIILTASMWFIIAYQPFFNKNFDLVSTIVSYITFFSGGCSIAALIYSGGRDLYPIGQIALLSFILSLFTLLLTKSVVLNFIGINVLLPVSIFSLFFLIKNIWIQLSANNKTLNE